MTNKQIALTGGLRTGKDTVAEYIEKEYGGSLYAFGDELKQDFHTKYPHIPWKPKNRKGYQLFGQLQRHVYGEDYWLNKCLSKINMGRVHAEGWLAWKSTYNSSYDFIPVITDVRQPNEVARCRKDGYILIRTQSELDTRVRRAEEAGDEFDIKDLEHETERDVDSYAVDFEINNNGTLEELYASVDTIMLELGIGKVVKRDEY